MGSRHKILYTTDEFVSRQLSAQEAELAREHAEHLVAALESGDSSRIRSWVARRLVSEDVVSQLHAARREALVRENQLSGALVRALKAFDGLANSAHRRALDWAELLLRLEGGRAPNVRIGHAQQVAFVSGQPAQEAAEQER
jgi:hypothetical protein